MTLIDVHFQWSDEYGFCYDCGRPAAYLIGDRRESADTADLRCSVCAADCAADGEIITRLTGRDSDG